VTGAGFTGATAVSLDGYPATYTVVNDTTITLTVPSGASTGSIHVKTAAGLAASATNFTVTTAPTITSFSPGSGPVGSVVTVTGTGFTGASAVSVDGYPANYSLASDTSLTFTVPKGASTGVIHVKTSLGLGASATNFTVTAN
jgi:type IV pilus biogenesis protein CpaD/CtpE